MENTILLILGGALTVFGALVTFSQRFNNYMHKSFWKPTNADVKALSVEGLVSHNRHRGLIALLTGIFLLILWYIL